MRTTWVRVKAEIVRPSVVSLPRVVAALEQKIRRTVIAHDENHVALPVRCVCLVRQGGQPAKVHTTGPVVGDRQRHSRIPSATAQAFLSNGRLGLLFALERAECFHGARTASSIVAHSENLDRELRCRRCAHRHVDALPGLNRLARAVTLDVRIVVTLGPHPGELPVTGPLAFIFPLDPIFIELPPRLGLGNTTGGKGDGGGLEEITSGGTHGDEGMRLPLAHKRNLQCCCRMNAALSSSPTSMARLLSTLALAAGAVAGDCAAWPSYRAGSGGAF